MAARRSLNNAMSPDKLAFIEGTTGIKPLDAVTSKSSQPLDGADQTKTTAGDQSPQCSKSPLSRNREATNSQDEHQPWLFGELRAPVTTRLNLRTADALRRATLEQRLNRRKPATQQEIIEQALQDWLTNNAHWR